MLNILKCTQIQQSSNIAAVYIKEALERTPNFFNVSVINVINVHGSSNQSRCPQPQFNSEDKKVIHLTITSQKYLKLKNTKCLFDAVLKHNDLYIQEYIHRIYAMILEQ